MHACVYLHIFYIAYTDVFWLVWLFKQSVSLFSVVRFSALAYITCAFLSNSGMIQWKWKCLARERFVVLCDSVQGAIVETISQLFSLACDRLVGLMWEPHTPPPPIPAPLLLLPATNTPSPQRLRLATESAGGKGVCTAVASEQERKQNSWRRIKSGENGVE